MLYGARENFVDRYSGRYAAEVLEAREEDFPEVPELSTLNNLRDFRAGMIYANIRRFNRLSDGRHCRVPQPLHGSTAGPQSQ